MEGPRLGGVYGRSGGRVKSFGYSRHSKGSKIVWNEQTLDQWLTDPEKMAPGTEMEFRVETAVGEAGDHRIFQEALKAK